MELNQRPFLTAQERFWGVEGILLLLPWLSSACLIFLPLNAGAVTGICRNGDGDADATCGAFAPQR